MFLFPREAATLCQRNIEEKRLRREHVFVFIVQINILIHKSRLLGFTLNVYSINIYLK